MKTNVEKLIYSLKRKNPNIHIDDEFQDQTKFYVKRFLTESNRLCSSNQKAVAILPSMAICPWNLFCRDHSRVFI